MERKTRANWVIAGCIVAFAGLFLPWFTVSGPDATIPINEFGIAINGGLLGLIYWLVPISIVILFIIALASRNAIGGRATKLQRYLFWLCVLGIFVGFIKGLFGDNPTLSSEGVSWSIGIGFFITLLGFIFSGIGIVSTRTFTPKK
jgi:hypothetical protein